MGATEIVAKIMEEAKVEVQRIEEENKEKAAKIIKEAKEEIEKRRNKFIEAEKRKEADEKERRIRSARLNARKKKWEVQEEMVNKALNEAMGRVKEVKIEGFKGLKYSEILENLTKEAAMNLRSSTNNDLQNRELEIMLSEEDVKAAYVDKAVLSKVSKEVGVTLILSEERIRGVGGSIVRRKDGRIAVDNTFEKRMERLLGDIREDIVKVLFKAGE